MKVIGRMTWQTDKVNLWIPMAHSIRVNGSTICNMEKARKVGITRKQHIADSSTKEKRMVKGYSNGKMVVFMMETLLMDTSRDKELITLQIWINGIEANSE